MQTNDLDATGFYKVRGGGGRKIKMPANSPSSVFSSVRQDSPRQTLYDRFIPVRSDDRMELVSHYLLQSTRPPPLKRACKQLDVNFQESLSQALLATPLPPPLDAQPSNNIYGAPALSPLIIPSNTPRVLTFEAPASSRSNVVSPFDNKLKVLYRCNRYNDANSREERPYEIKCHKVLDAPEFTDDYYLNLLDWNSANIIAVALGNTVYLWNATTSEITQLFTTANSLNRITSISWADDVHLAIGTTCSDLLIWDCIANKQLRRLDGHTARISSLAWNGPVLSSSGRGTFIFNHDVRADRLYFSAFQGHSQEVCALKWSPDGTKLASGANDNDVNIWKLSNTSKALHTFNQHIAAVKGINWCPWKSELLATGGGTADRTIKLWDTTLGTCIDSIDTGSQVCSVLWSKNSKEIISSHGYSQYQLAIWKYPTLTKVADLFGHTSRVLHTAMSPDGTIVVSLSGDETIRFWKVSDTLPLRPINKKQVELKLTSQLKTKTGLIR